MKRRASCAAVAFGGDDTKEAQEALGSEPRAVQATLRRLRKRAEIATPVRGGQALEVQEVSTGGAGGQNLHASGEIEATG